MKEELMELFEEMQGMFVQKSEEMEKFGKVSEELEEKIDLLTEAFNKMKSDSEKLGYNKKQEKITLGRMFVNQFKDRVGKDNISGKFSTVVSRDASGNVLTGTDRVQIPGLPVKVRISDIVPVIHTDSVAVDYVEYTSTNRASAKAEGVAFDESDFDGVIKTVSLVAIGHTIDVSYRVYESDTELVAFIEESLVEGVLDAREAQMLNGTGESGQMVGLLHHPKVQKLDVQDPLEESTLDYIRKAITKTRAINRHADAIVLNPYDVEKLDLAREGDKGAYVLGGPGGVDTVWRIPVIETADIAEGTFLVGSFRTCAKIRPLETVNVSASKDFKFNKNVYTVKAYEDSVLTIEVPEAFVKGTFAE